VVQRQCSQHQQQLSQLRRRWRAAMMPCSPLQAPPNTRRRYQAVVSPPIGLPGWGQSARGSGSRGRGRQAQRLRRRLQNAGD
jgi:hypothetical protein